MDTAEANRMRWAFQRGHYEVWYATLSHLASRTGFWIRYTLEAPEADHGEPYAQLWFARFDGNDAARTFGINKKLMMIKASEIMIPHICASQYNVVLFTGFKIGIHGCPPKLLMFGSPVPVSICRLRQSSCK